MIGRGAMCVCLAFFRVQAKFFVVVRWRSCFLNWWQVRFCFNCSFVTIVRHSVGWNRARPWWSRGLLSPLSSTSRVEVVMSTKSSCLANVDMQLSGSIFLAEKVLLYNFGRQFWISENSTGFLPRNTFIFTRLCQQWIYFYYSVDSTERCGIAHPDSSVLFMSNALRYLTKCGDSELQRISGSFLFCFQWGLQSCIWHRNHSISSNSSHG